MPDDKKPRKGWSEEAKLVDPLVLFLGAQDEFGHRGYTGNLAIPPWVRDSATELKDSHPGYKGKTNNVFRDALVVGLKVRLAQFDDGGEAYANARRTMQLLIDQEEQSWELQQFAAMGQYADSCEATLRVQADAKNWMRVSKHLEKMRQRIADGLLIEPHRSRVESIVELYAELLKGAKVE